MPGGANKHELFNNRNERTMTVQDKLLVQDLLSVQDLLVIRALKTDRIEGGKDTRRNQRLCLVYLCILSSYRTKKVHIKVTTIAQDLDMPDRTARKTLARLEAAELIHKCSKQRPPVRCYMIGDF